MVYDQYIDIESEWRVIFDNNWEKLFIDNHELLRKHYQVPFVDLIKKEKVKEDDDQVIEKKQKKRKYEEKRPIVLKKEKKKKESSSSSSSRFKSKICMTFATLLGYIIVSFIFIIHFIH